MTSPRTRGDDPAIKNSLGTKMAFSPHPRG